MDVFFAKLFNMSLVSSLLIAVVMILRFALKKSPKWISCLMWALVAVRLVVPFSFESAFSLVPSASVINPAAKSAYVETGFKRVDTFINSKIPETAVKNIDIITIIGYIWLAGAAAMLIYMIISYIILRKKVRESISVERNIRICDHISSPFILGIFKPTIYINSAVDDSNCDYVIAHEKAHLSRGDNLWKPFGFIILSLYWFNPLCWIAFWLFNKDIELACDEKVVKAFDTKSKKEYATALLSCSVNRSRISAYPVSFGECNVKHRIKNVLGYKKPVVALIAFSLICCVACALFFMTDPISNQEKITFSAEKPSVSATDFSENNPINPADLALAETIPVTEALTQSVETKPIETKPVETQPPTESAAEDDYYNDTDYYDNYYDTNYYGDTYSDNYNDDTYMDIVPLNETKEYQDSLFNLRIGEGYSSGDLFAGVASPYKKYTTPEDFVIPWDYAVTNSNNYNHSARSDMW